MKYIKYIIFLIAFSLPLMNFGQNVDSKKDQNIEIKNNPKKDSKVDIKREVKPAVVPKAKTEPQKPKVKQKVKKAPKVKRDISTADFINFGATTQIDFLNHVKGIGFGGFITYGIQNKYPIKLEMGIGSRILENDVHKQLYQKNSSSIRDAKKSELKNNYFTIGLSGGYKYSVTPELSFSILGGVNFDMIYQSNILLKSKLDPNIQGGKKYDKEFHVDVKDEVRNMLNGFVSLEGQYDLGMISIFAGVRFTHSATRLNQSDFDGDYYPYYMSGVVGVALSLNRGEKPAVKK